MSEHATNPNISSASIFTDAEWDHLRAEDFSAGKAVVWLMVGIFSTGVILYSCVASAVVM